jgi:hypothetical protein
MPVKRLSISARNKSPWLQHVDETIRKFPSISSYQAALKRASKTYEKGEAKPRKAAKPRKKAVRPKTAAQMRAARKPVMPKMARPSKAVRAARKPVMPKMARPSKEARGGIKKKGKAFSFPLDF